MAADHQHPKMSPSLSHQYYFAPNITIYHILSSVQKLLEKVEHYKIFWDNAEINCRLEKQPLPDEQDDGSFTGFDYSFYLLKSDLNQSY